MVTDEMIETIQKQYPESACAVIYPETVNEGWDFQVFDHFTGHAADLFNTCEPGSVMVDLNTGIVILQVSEE